MKNYLIAVITLLFSIVLTTNAQAASSCKGKAKMTCSSGCTWVDSYKTKTGKKVSGYCRAKPGKGASTKSKTTKSKASTKAKGKAKAAESKTKNKSKAAKSKAKAKVKATKNKTKKATSKAKKPAKSKAKKVIKK